MSSGRLTGRVKWFNSKSGFGFITVIGGERAGEDIFAHYSSVRGDTSQYKSLVQGEYVEFVLSKSESEQHEYHATDISGIHGGLLMCDTQQASMPPRPVVATMPPRVQVGVGNQRFPYDPSLSFGKKK
jgi:cold shock CspA family protein